MSALFKSIIVATFGLLLAVVLGMQIGEGSLAVPVVLLLAFMVGGIYLLFFRTIRLEALAVGFLLIGYFVGNRGFAQISLAAGSPLYLGEIGLGIGVAMLGLRLALNREKVLPSSPLGWAIAAFLTVGAVRLFFDAVIRLSPGGTMVAIRDSATIYYAGFFLVAYRLGQVPAARRFLEKCLWAGLILLPLVVLAQWLAPEALMSVRVRGYPVILHKDDLTTAYLSAGSIYLFLANGRGMMRVIQILGSAVYLALMLLIVTRAAIVGLAFAIVLLLLARQGRFLLLQGTVVALALIAMGLLQVTNLGGRHGSVASVADKFQSITDVSQTRTYRSASGEIASSNNQWRLSWWQNVFNETMSKGPFFGLGFGYDLANEFVREYYGNRHGGFETRSPHSVWVTVLGRMGLIGLVSFFAVVFLLWREALAAAARVARSRAAPTSLGHWCAVVILLGSASFGVVLEGPMGGIVFWALLGLAASTPITPLATRPTLALPRAVQAPVLRRAEPVPA